MRPWFERRFSFDHLGAADFSYLLERLAGVPGRVEEKTRELTAPEQPTIVSTSYATPGT